MDPDDPERRIADLERQLDDQEHIAGRENLDEDPGVTPEDIHDVAFSNPAQGRRGYNEDEVDTFFERVEATLRDPMATRAVTQAEIHNVSFSAPPIGRRGYNEDEVDAFVGRVAIELGRRSGQRAAGDQGQGAPQSTGATTDSGPRHLRHTEQSTARKTLDHTRLWVDEIFKNRGRVTWRGPLVLGLLFAVLGWAIHPAFFAVAGALLIWAALAMRFRWGG